MAHRLSVPASDPGDGAAARENRRAVVPEPTYGGSALMVFSNLLVCCCPAVHYQKRIVSSYPKEYGKKGLPTFRGSLLMNDVLI